MSFEDFMHQSALIYTLHAQSDASGGVYQEWVQTGTSACLVRPVSGGIDRDQAKDGSAATHIIFLPGSWPLTAANQIRVGPSIYNVIRPKDINSLAHHTEIECALETS